MYHSFLLAICVVTSACGEEEEEGERSGLDCSQEVGVLRCVRVSWSAKSFEL